MSVRLESGGIGRKAGVAVCLSSAAFLLTACVGGTGTAATSPAAGPMTGEKSDVVPETYVQPTAPEATGDPTARFLACLTDTGVEAMVLGPEWGGNGQVAIRYPEMDAEVVGDENITSSGNILELPASMQNNLLLNLSVPNLETRVSEAWIVVASAEAFTETAPELYASYSACENQHPEFHQPGSFLPDDTSTMPEGPEIDATSLAFAQCARAEGFANVADPQGPWSGVGIPSNITSDQLRAMLAACIDPESQILIHWQTGEPEFNVDEITNPYREAIAGFSK